MIGGQVFSGSFVVASQAAKAAPPSKGSFDQSSITFTQFRVRGGRDLSTYQSDAPPEVFARFFGSHWPFHLDIQVPSPNGGRHESIHAASHIVSSPVSPNRRLRPFAKCLWPAGPLENSPAIRSPGNPNPNPNAPSPVIYKRNSAPRSSNQQIPSLGTLIISLIISPLSPE